LSLCKRELSAFSIRPTNFSYSFRKNTKKMDMRNQKIRRRTSVTDVYN
jgi:hypothetical protein